MRAREGLDIWSNLLILLGCWVRSPGEWAVGELQIGLSRRDRHEATFAEAQSFDQNDLGHEYGLKPTRLWTGWSLVWL